MNVYKREDSFEGILVLYQLADGNNATTTTVEAMVGPGSFSSSTTSSSKHYSFALGTDFDPKELLFRNWVGAIGPESEVALMCSRRQ